MSRNLVYLNGQNETITFETGPYLIVKIEGLGIPNVNRQEQKAPYQDGTTYIDSLLQNRDIVVELAITKPNDFANIALYRRELSQRLCPKYGLGTLTYTDEDNNAYNIRAVVSSMVFPNKDYRDPYMRAMVTFTACDPYWEDVTTDSINLPTSFTSGESVVNGATSYAPSLIKLSNGDLFVAYQRGSDARIVCRTYSGSWGAEVPLSAGNSNSASAVERLNGDIVVAYNIYAGATVSRTYSGGSWGAEQTIYASAAFPSLLEKYDGTLITTYRVGTNIYISTYTTSWGTGVLALTGVNADYSAIAQMEDASLMLVYRGSTTYLYYSIFTTSWSTPIQLNSTVSLSPSLIRLSSGVLFLIYQINLLTSPAITQRYSGTWSSSAARGATQMTEPSAIEISATTLMIAYTNASGYLVTATRSVTPVPAVITGDVPAPFVVTFTGPSVNPRIINSNTQEYIQLNTTLAAADHFDVDTSFGNKTVVLVQGGIVKNGIAFLDIGSTFFQLERGTNTVYYEDDAVLSTATATMEWTERYVGL